MSRKTQTDFPGAFRVVITHEDGRKVYIGPYQTKAAARGQLSQETTGWYAVKGKTGHIERTTGAWEVVE